MIVQEMTGRIHSIETFGTVDGPGVRYVLFLQGCSLHCAYCHNPDSWDHHGGREVTVDEVIRGIVPYRSFIADGGVTLSGGEPLRQPAFTHAIIERCRQQGWHTAIDTAGSVPLEQCRDAVTAADLLLLDVKAPTAEAYRALTGGRLDTTLEVLDYRESLGKPVWIRHVLLPGYTLENASLQALAALLRPYTCIQRVELLPFHKLGEYKWDRLGRPYTLRHVQPPTAEQVAHARAVLSAAGLPLA